jgi:hypothetical protein
MTPRRKKTLKIASLLFALCLVLFVIITYSFYLDLKRTFLDKISDKATVLVGQRVSIGDLSFGPSGRINLRDIVVRNPGGFDSGRLLGIKGLSVDPNWLELLKGRINLKSIEIRSPELTLSTDDRGITNISEELKYFLSRKGAGRYSIGELRIRDGYVSLNNRILATGSEIALSLKNLSSHGDVKTLLSGALSYAGNSAHIEGWVYLNSTAKNFRVSLSSEDFVLSAFREALGKYRVDAGKVNLDIKVDAEGDTAKGCKINSRMRLKGTNFLPLYRDRSDIRLESDAFYDILQSSLAVNYLSLYEGDTPSLHLKGAVMEIGRNLSYSTDIKITKIDLSRLNLMKGAEMAGELTSDTIQIEGRAGETPRISGSIRLKGGALRSRNIRVEKTNADLKLSGERELDVTVTASARVLRLREYLAGKHFDASISLKARGRPEKAALISNIRLSPLELKAKDGKTVFLNNTDLSVEGIASGLSIFSGTGLLELKGITAGDYKIPLLSGSLFMDYRKDFLSVKDLKIATEGIEISAGRLEARMDWTGRAYSVEITDMSVSSAVKELDVKNTGLVLTLRTGKETVSGEAALSGNVSFRGISAKEVSGHVRFAENEFSLSVPAALVAGGRVTLNATGKMSGEPFPIRAELTAEGVDLGVLSRAYRFSALPYAGSGTLEQASLNGIVESPLSFRGKVMVGTGKFSLVGKDDNKKVLRDARVTAEFDCGGKDCAFRSDIAAGKLRVGASGDIRKFVEKKMEVSVKAFLPETKVADMRNALWDIFPDRLLYTGLDGYLSSEMTAEYSAGGLKVEGNISLKNILIEGENGEYTIGPINGTVPLLYDTTKDVQTVALPSFEPSEFQNLGRYYSREFTEKGYQRITIGSLRYGFRLLDGINIWARPEAGLLEIGRFDANIFGGRLNGSGSLGFSDGLRYRAGFILQGLSLTRLCEEIEPIKGYVSGKVDGVATVKGSGTGVSRLMGKADFWAYSSGDEKTRISREFLQKVGGPSLKAYLGDRNFDKGIMSLYLQDGYAVFRELEISHRNMMGFTDLSLKVAPYSNRIGIDHLLWTVAEAAQRTKYKQ